MSEQSDQIQARLDKLVKIREMGVNPYPYAFKRTHMVQDVRDNFDALEKSGEKVRICGRLVAFRRQGKTAFANIKDAAGRIQIYARQDSVGVQAWELFKLLDYGDFIGLTGTAFKTRTGEPSVGVSEFVLLAKAVRPLPIPKEKTGPDGKKTVYDEFKDLELRSRKRHLDLALNDAVVERFRRRTVILQTVRQYLVDRGFLEVETPTLQPIYGGAAARPFVTHHNSLHLDLYLRISNELYLKRLVIGGMEKVFEFVKDFRNEGIDRTHNPEFTQVEFYEAYADYNDMMTHVENIYAAAAKAVNGTTKINFDGREIDFAPPWQRLSMAGALKQYGNLDVAAASDGDLKEALKTHHVETEGPFVRGLAVQALFEALCEPHLVQPVFITDHPAESTPLCKAHRTDPALVERFEPFINGWEVGNAYSELNDPVLQRRLLKAQAELGRGGDEEAHPMDEDFVQAMEYGMPPTGGVGLGIDRLVMLLTGTANIRDAILFPLMKPE